MVEDVLKELKAHRDMFLKGSSPWRVVNRAVKFIEELKKENNELRLKMSYMVDPNVIGDRHEMGCW